jgi:hypothetical protein
MICLPPGGGAAGMGSMIITCSIETRRRRDGCPAVAESDADYAIAATMSSPATAMPDISHIRSPALNSKTRRSIYDMSCQRAGSGMVPL